jgi:hypothetical protein
MKDEEVFFSRQMDMCIEGSEGPLDLLAPALGCSSRPLRTHLITRINPAMDLVQKFQSLVLETIAKEGSIPDSLALHVDGNAVDQLQLLGSLNSLSSRDVSHFISLLTSLVCSLHSH